MTLMSEKSYAYKILENISKLEFRDCQLTRSLVFIEYNNVSRLWEY